MSDTESLLERLAVEFPISHAQGIDMYVHFTQLSSKMIESSKLTRILKQVQSNWRDTFSNELIYHFDIVPSDPQSSLKIILQRLTDSFQQEPENRFLNTMSAQRAIFVYSVQRPLTQKLMDYKLYIESNKKQQKGLHCVLHEIEDYGLNQASGVATTGGPYMLLSISRSERALTKHMLHEIGHCFGGGHSYFPFSIMYPTTNTLLGCGTYWDPISKRNVKEGLKRLNCG